MNLDPTQLADWQIAEAAEIQMRSIETLVEKIGIETDEWIPQGKGIAKLNISVAKGKREFDKRNVIKDRESKISLKRIKKNFNN